MIKIATGAIVWAIVLEELPTILKKFDIVSCVKKAKTQKVKNAEGVRRRFERKYIVRLKPSEVKSFAGRSPTIDAMASVQG